MPVGDAVMPIVPINAAYIRDIARQEMISGPSAAATRVNVQSIADATDVAVTWELETWDVGGLFTLSSPTRMTVPSGQAGKYLATLNARWAYSAGSNSQVQVWVNGVKQQYVGTPQALADGLAFELDLAAGDYVQMYVRQESGGALNLLASSTFRLQRVM